MGVISPTITKLKNVCLKSVLECFARHVKILGSFSNTAPRPGSPKSETTWTTGLPLPVYSYIQDQCILKGHNVLRPLSDGNTPLGLPKYCPLIWLHCSDKYPTWYGWISEVPQIILGAVYWHPSNGWHTLQVVCGVPQPNMGIFPWRLCQKPRLNEERLFPQKKKRHSPYPVDISGALKKIILFFNPTLF